MELLSIYISSLENRLIHKHSGDISTVTRTCRHPLLRSKEHIYTHYSQMELLRLYRRFGHAHVNKCVNPLRCAEVSGVTTKTRGILERIEHLCSLCQKNAQSLRRVEFILRHDGDCNHTVDVDIYITGKPVLHMADEDTGSQAALWLLVVSAESLWSALHACRIDVYLGPPEIITHNAGTRFMARAFQASADILHIATKSILVEAAHSMSIVEHYHSPSCRTFHIIRHEIPGIDDDSLQQMAVICTNE